MRKRQRIVVGYGDAASSLKDTIRRCASFLLALVLLAIPNWASAATIPVNNTDDELNVDGDCSLRESIQAANTDTAIDACPAGSGADVIVVPAGVYLISDHHRRIDGGRKRHR